jgi:hypothetical protein
MQTCTSVPQLFTELSRSVRSSLFSAAPIDPYTSNNFIAKLCIHGIPYRNAFPCASSTLRLCKWIPRPTMPGDRGSSGHSQKHPSGHHRHHHHHHHRQLCRYDSVFAFAWLLVFWTDNCPDRRRGHGACRCRSSRLPRKPARSSTTR